MIDSDKSTRLDDDQLKLVLGGNAALEQGDYLHGTGWNRALDAVWGGAGDLARQSVAAPELATPSAGSRGRARRSAPIDAER
jgi:hypothetical protein